MAQSAVDLGTHRHFDQVVIHVPVDNSPLGELETLGGVDIALDFTVDHGMRHLHLTCHFTALNDAQDGVLPRLRLNAAVDFTFDIEMPGKSNVASDSGTGRNQSCST